MLVAEDEQRLSGWVPDHLRVSWAEHADPAAVARDAIGVRVLVPPLGQAADRRHPVHAVVRQPERAGAHCAG